MGYQCNRSGEESVNSFADYSASNYTNIDRLRSDFCLIVIDNKDISKITISLLKELREVRLSKRAFLLHQSLNVEIRVVSLITHRNIFFKTFWKRPSNRHYFRMHLTRLVINLWYTNSSRLGVECSNTTVVAPWFITHSDFL